MDLPEKLLPRISSRMGIQRLCFGPYNFHQLKEIISTRLKGIDAFEDQAIEFACRKVNAALCIILVHQGKLFLRTWLENILYYILLGLVEFVHQGIIGFVSRIR